MWLWGAMLFKVYALAKIGEILKKKQNTTGPILRISRHKESVFYVLFVLKTFDSSEILV